jgi:hypothetical protein
MLYREIIALCSQVHAKHTNALRAEHRISECYSWWYIKYVLGFKRLNITPTADTEVSLRHQDKKIKEDGLIGAWDR